MHRITFFARERDLATGTEHAVRQEGYLCECGERAFAVSKYAGRWCTYDLETGLYMSSGHKTRAEAITATEAKIAKCRAGYWDSAYVKDMAKAYQALVAAYEKELSNA